MKKFEIPGSVSFNEGKGGLTKIDIRTRWSAAEIYLHGAQITGFQKTGEPPLLFMSRLSQFASGKAIRGGVPICFPWFGPRDGDVAHGFARVTEWEVISTAMEPSGAVTVRLRLPETPAKAKWPTFATEFVVTIAETLTMELVTTNRSNHELIFEDCLHTYFAVGEITKVSVSGLKSAWYLDKADGGRRKQETAEAIVISQETNRTYLNTAGAVEIHDAAFNRIIRIGKSGSNSTVVWNPWTTQLMSDFAVEEHAKMVCVESGNVGENKIVLNPGATVVLKVVLSSRN
ncbi:MAG TPA: D-hexose-6-phosphate mutarotase [Candidatus Paceibacterota bacterium]|nr:D-hexose-6-phosphate mutarotase [Candidatus Paceibacterota bacterium]